MQLAIKTEQQADKIKYSDLEQEINKLMDKQQTDNFLYKHMIRNYGGPSTGPNSIRKNKKELAVVLPIETDFVRQLPITNKKQI